MIPIIGITSKRNISSSNPAQMAVKWSELNDSGRYRLQYRTAQGERVRESHAILANTTLPKEDSFWLQYYPPNGWNCRCTVVELRREKYKESDSEEAIKKGERATTQINKDGKNKLTIFRFNSGQEKKLFRASMRIMPTVAPTTVK